MGADVKTALEQKIRAAAKAGHLSKQRFHFRISDISLFYLTLNLSPSS